jgi:hypothetical protein
VDNQTGNHMNLDSARITSDNLGVKKLRLGAYKADLYEVEKVKTFISRLGIYVDPQMRNNDQLYFWETETGRASYSLQSGLLKVDDSTGLKLEDIERGYIDEESVKDYFEQFEDLYLEYAEEYEFEVSENGNMFQVQGTLKLQGYDVVAQNDRIDLFSVVFNEGGDLVSMSAVLVDFRQIAQEVDLVEVDALKNLIKQNSYPRSEFIQVIPGSQAKCNDYHCMYDVEMDEIQNIVFDEAQIKYYLDSTTSESVLPVYELKGKGRYYDEIEEATHDIVITVYANAVDPSKLYVSQD